MTQHEIPHVGPTEQFPHRPDHKDFDLLSVLVTTLDSQADEAAAADGTFDLTAMVANYVDPESLAYLALQRAFRVLNITTQEQVKEKWGEATNLATMYHEGFLMGARFQKVNTPSSQAKIRRNARSGDPRKRAQS